MPASFRSWCLATVLVLGSLAIGARVWRELSPPSAVEFQKNQLVARYGALLGLQDGDADSRKVLDEVIEPLLRRLRDQDETIVFTEGANPAKAISASIPDIETKTVWIYVDKELCAAKHADPAERREMAWFALLHELQNAMRAPAFREIGQRGRKGTISEEEYVVQEIQQEVASIRAAYAHYVAEVWPRMRDLGVESPGKVQADYGPMMAADPEQLVSQYAGSEIGDYYRAGYRRYRESNVKNEASQ